MKYLEILNLSLLLVHALPPKPTSNTPAVKRIGVYWLGSLQPWRTHTAGNYGVSHQERVRRDFYGNLASVTRFGGRLKKQAFATDWVLSGSKSNSMMGYHNHFCLGGRRKEEGLKLQLVKNQ